MNTVRIVVFFALAVSNFFVCNAQDKIITLSRDTLSVEILESNDTSFKFRYPGENSLSVLSKDKVLKAIYNSGRIEICTTVKTLPKISGKDDWEKVMVTFEPNDVMGLTKCGEVTGKSSFGAMMSVQGGKNAIKEMQKDAAKLGAGIILIIRGWDERKNKPISGYGRGVKLVVLFTSEGSPA